MKKLMLAMIGILFFMSAKPIDLFGQDSVLLEKYVGYIGAIDKVLKGDPTGFSELIKMATVEIQALDFSKITTTQVEVIKSFIKDGLSNQNPEIVTQAKNFATMLISKLSTSMQQNPVLISGLIQQISTLLGISNKPDMRLPDVQL